jgi:hypothetical protein
MMKAIYLLFVGFVVLAACSQNIENVSNGERIENAPTVDAAANPRPLAIPEGAAGEAEVPPFVKAYFMHMFVEALYSVPGNNNPNPNWSSPLKDPVNNRVWCTDCHTDPSLDFGKIPKQKMAMNEELENNHEFMVDLMTKWVGRLNSDEFKAKAKLKQPVTCTTCHATDPRQDPQTRRQ